MGSTNYTNAFISVAADCAAEAGTVPPERWDPTIARMQYDMVSGNPYAYTSDEVIFAVHCARNGIASAEMEAARAAFFAKGRACLRASPLARRYGWGIHHDARSRVALYARESEDYVRLSNDPTVEQVRALKGRR